MKLCPAQQKAFDYLMEAYPVGHIFAVWAHAGMGRTTILEELHRQHGGEFLTMRDYIQELSVRNPLAMDETLDHMLMKAHAFRYCAISLMSFRLRCAASIPSA